MPSHTVIRDWILQVGYYKIMTIKKAKDWIGIIDLSIQVGSKKCLLILGVRAATLLNKKPLTFEDVSVLHIELLEKTSGSIIYEAIKKSEAKVGQYIQFCQDQGSDIGAGARLYIQNVKEKEGRKIILVNDISHKIANLLAIEVEKLGWSEFASQVSKMKNRLQFTQWAILCPPNQRSKSRYMNLDEIINWSKKIILHIKETEEKCSTLQKQFFLENQYLKNLLEKFGWIKSKESMIYEISELLFIGKIVRQKIRNQGIHLKTSSELELELQNLSIRTSANQFVNNILDFIDKQTKDLEDTRIALGCTEIIESVFGKLKQLMDEDTKDGFTPFVLSIAACVGKLNLEIVQKALSSSSKKQVNNWIKENFPESICSQRRKLFRFFSKSKIKQLKDWWVQDLATINIDKVMNL